MGTNFYMFTSDKETKQKYFPMRTTSLTDEPEFGYEIKIAKTSGGWKPSFQEHEHIKSIADYKRLYDTGMVKILDEYWDEYTWDEFVKRVLEWGNDNPNSLSHMDENFYCNCCGGVKSYYFLSEDGYEFLREIS